MGEYVNINFRFFGRGGDLVGSVFSLPRDKTRSSLFFRICSRGSVRRFFHEIQR